MTNQKHIFRGSTTFIDNAFRTLISKDGIKWMLVLAKKVNRFPWNKGICGFSFRTYSSEEWNDMTR